MNVIQDTIDILRGKKQLVVELKNSANYKRNYSPNKKISERQFKQIVILGAGFAYAGSSAVIGFLNEFNNTFVSGNNDKICSKNNKRLGYEPRWFTHSGFVEFTDAFKEKDTQSVKADLAIKLFIKQLYLAYENKSLLGWDKAPDLYTDEFLQINENYLKEVLDFNDYDISFLKDKKIPATLYSKGEKWQGCSFVKGEGMLQYLFYSFKNISNEYFDECTQRYIKAIFDIYKEKREYAVFDKLIWFKDHKKINHFLKNEPIKQIVVIRDPRDEYLAIYRKADTKILPYEAQEWADIWKEKYAQLMANKDENMIIIRFEELVYDYDKNIKKIMDFLGLKEKNHIEPKSIFDPEISKTNIGAWREFTDQDFMKKTGELLSEYCYNQNTSNSSSSDNQIPDDSVVLEGTAV